MRIRQVILNLASNAIKFTDQGEVNLSVKVLERESSGYIVQFTFSDTGIGIAPEKLQLIFNPFSQADGSTTRKYGGTGLGLTISNRLVEMMGGRMWVESEVGKGSRFHFTVQLGVAKAGVLARTAASALLAGRRVLIVDDNQTNRRILEEMLRCTTHARLHVHAGVLPGDFSVIGGQLLVAGRRQHRSQGQCGATAGLYRCFRGRRNT